MSAHASVAVFNALAPWLNGGEKEAGIRDFLGDMLCLCESYHITPERLHELIDEAIVENQFEYEGDDYGRYDGWERIHDNNKAEGRPIGRQWSKEGVWYDASGQKRRT